MSESTHNCNSDLDAVIREVKEELKTIFFKRKDLILKLGEAFKNIVSDNESICEEIKNALNDEIRDGHISARDIERHCPDEWKQKTKPKKPKNDKLSFPRPEQEAVLQLLVDADGNSVVEPAAVPASDSNYNDVVNNEESENVGAKYTKEFRAANTLEDKGKSTDSQLKELKSNLEAQYHDDQETKFLDIQFEVPFETLREHMASSFRMHAKSIWFFVKVHLVSKSVSDVQMG